MLEVPLLRKSTEKEGMIDVNMSGRLIKLIMEIHYWQRLGFEIPHYCADVYTKKEEIIGMRENVLTIVLDYNRIIGSLSVEERGLFKERIKTLDKRIQPGFSKLTWTKIEAAEEFTHTCRRHASELQAVVDKYKDSLMHCFRCCKKISEELLVKIVCKRPFENLEFEEDQAKHRRQAMQKLLDHYESIEHTLKNVHEIFKKDESEEVLKF